jgi:hypothetical protein
MKTYHIVYTCSIYPFSTNLHGMMDEKPFWTSVLRNMRKLVNISVCLALTMECCRVWFSQHPRAPLRYTWLCSHQQHEESYSLLNTKASNIPWKWKMELLIIWMHLSCSVLLEWSEYNIYSKLIKMPRGCRPCRHI